MIRPASKSDIPDIVRMSELFWSKSPYDDVDFCPESCSNMAEYCIDYGVMLVIDDGGVHGFICGVMGPILGNKSVLVCTEVAWWVDESHRSGGDGIRLLREMEKAAKEKGCKRIAMMFMESSMPAQIEKIYQNMGYNRVETTYSKVL